MQNIGLTERLDAKLIDFGFACKCIINKTNQTERGDVRESKSCLTDSLIKPTSTLFCKSIDSELTTTNNLETQSSFLSNEKLNTPISVQQPEQIIQFSMSQCGTPLYIPPEVIIADKCPYDPRKADIWSLGVTMFSIVSYRYPFTKRDYKVLYKQQLKRTWISKRIYTCFSEDAFDLMKYMLEPMPKKRFTATQVLQHDWIRKFLKNRDNNEDQERSLESNRSVDGTDRIDQTDKIDQTDQTDQNDQTDQIKQTKQTDQTNQTGRKDQIAEIDDLSKQMDKVRLNRTSESDHSETVSIISYESNAISQSILSTTTGLDSQSCIGH